MDPRLIDQLPRKPIPMSGRTRLLGWQGTHTVCEESRCPNREECSRNGLATFLIGGSVCTRRCTYCDIATGRPTFGAAEMEREIKTITAAVEKLKLKYVVVTAVNRDDLADGGATHFANLARSLREKKPDIDLEVLAPDFKFNRSAWETIADSRPSVLAHNLETVERLFPVHRRQGHYQKSREMLAWFRHRGFITKTALILGMGEKPEEIRRFLEDCRETGVEILTIGQYLSPGPGHPPPDKIYTKQEWREWEEEIRANYSFRHLEIGPFVRSSYMAHRALES